ncbi:MAG: hypothetical protein RSB51_05275 [Clostridia bacterium]
MDALFTVGVTITVLIFGLAFTYLILNTKDEDSIQDEDKEAYRKARELSNTNIKDQATFDILGKKMFEAKEKLKAKKFNVDFEIVSPVENVGKAVYLKMACFDDNDKKMAIISIVQNAKDFLINYYDIDNIIKCEMEVNDKEVYVGKDEVDYKLKSIKLNIQRNDIYNPEYTIGILPKLVSNPEKTFRAEYFEFARQIQAKILDNGIL